MGALKRGLTIFDSQDFKSKTGYKLEAKNAETGDAIYSKYFPRWGKNFFASVWLIAVGF